MGNQIARKARGLEAAVVDNSWMPTETFVAGVSKVMAESLSAVVTRDAIGFLRDLFGVADAAGSRMAARALDPLEDPLTVAASCSSLARDLLSAMG
jgi:hypothetical protein